MDPMSRARRCLRQTPALLWLGAPVVVAAAATAMVVVWFRSRSPPAWTWWWPKGHIPAPTTHQARRHAQVPPPSTTQGACANVHMRNAGASTCIKCTHGQYQQATRSRIRCIYSREFLDQCQLNLFASGGQLLESEHGMRMHSVIVSVYFIVLPVAITTSRVSCACKADRSLVCLALYS